MERDLRVDDFEVELVPGRRVYFVRQLPRDLEEDLTALRADRKSRRSENRIDSRIFFKGGTIERYNRRIYRSKRRRHRFTIRIEAIDWNVLSALGENQSHDIAALSQTRYKP